MAYTRGLFERRASLPCDCVGRAARRRRVYDSARCPACTVNAWHAATRAIQTLALPHAIPLRAATLLALPGSRDEHREVTNGVFCQGFRARGCRRGCERVERICGRRVLRGLWLQLRRRRRRGVCADKRLYGRDRLPAGDRDGPADGLSSVDELCAGGGL